MSQLCLCGCGRKAKNEYVHGHNTTYRSRDNAGNKQCPTCQQWKPFTAEFFPRAGKRGLAANCKPCHVAKGLASERRRRESPEYFERRRAKWREERRTARAKDKQHSIDISWRSTLKLRREMIAAYGGACACCGESELMFLTLDHVHRNGAEHRNLLRTGGGYAVWRDLRKKGWPKDGYAILCWNCHMVTCWSRPCPHQSNRTSVTTDVT